MVLAVIYQIAIIVLDRYLYLNKECFVIEELHCEGEEEDLFDHDHDDITKCKSSIDLRSSEFEHFKSNFRKVHRRNKNNGHSSILEPLIPEQKENSDRHS